MEEKSIDISALFGKNLKKYRKSAGFTQEQLSEKLEITQKHLSMLETGSQFASAPLISKICGVLDVAPSKLFETDFDENESNRLFARLETFFKNEITQSQTIILNEIRNQ